MFNTRNLNITKVRAHYHAEIRENTGLLKSIKARVVSKVEHTEKYVLTGLQADGVFLGLDFSSKHIEKFKEILVHSALLDNLSKNQVDMSRVLLPLSLNGKHVATITEDVSENNRLRIVDEGFINLYCQQHLQNVFVDTPDLPRAVFCVISRVDISSEERFKPITTTARYPIIDLDHVELLPMFSDLYERTRIDPDIWLNLDDVM